MGNNQAAGDTNGTMQTNGSGAPEKGQVVRKSFGSEEVERSPETAQAALVAQAEASVRARFVMALQRPRNMDMVRLKIMAACKRPTFAQTAVYAKPVGKKKNPETGAWEEAFAEGLSIRFAEEAIRNFGNAMTETIVLYDDDDKRIIQVSATDLEANVVHFKGVTVDKTVERKVLKRGQVALGTRVNSYDELVFIVKATDDETTTKAGALSAKALRDKILMLIPSDIQEDAKALIWKTQAAADAEDPEGSRKALVDSFAEVGVMPLQLAELIGHDVGILQPAERKRLRAIYAAIRDGEATWGDVIGSKRDFEREKDDKDKAKAATKPGAPAPAAVAPGKANLDDLAAAARAKREEAAAATAKPQAATPPAAAKTAAGPATVRVPIKTAAPRAAAPPEPAKEVEDAGDLPDWMKTPGGQPPPVDEGDGDDDDNEGIT